MRKSYGDVPPNMIPELDYETKGYNAKHTFMTIFTLMIGAGVVGIMFYVVIRLFNAVGSEWLELGGVAFLFLLITLTAIGGSVTIIYVAKALATPGRQLPGRLGDWEERVEKKW